VWTDCDSARLIGINGGFCVGKELKGFRAALVWTDCDSEWLIGINVGFCVEKEFKCLGLLWRGQIVIVSG
jgi:hypothetical protein